MFLMFSQKHLFDIMGVCVFACTHLRGPPALQMPLEIGGHIRSPELELKMVVNCSMGAGSNTRVLCRVAEALSLRSLHLLSLAFRVVNTQTHTYQTV